RSLIDQLQQKLQQVLSDPNAATMWKQAGSAGPQRRGLSSVWGQPAFGNKPPVPESYDYWRDRYFSALVEQFAEQLLLIEDWGGVTQAVEKLRVNLLELVNQIGADLPD